MWVSNFCEEGKFEMIHESPELVSNEGRTGMIGVGVALSVAPKHKCRGCSSPPAGRWAFSALSSFVAFGERTRRDTRGHSFYQYGKWRRLRRCGKWRGTSNEYLGLRTSDLSEQVGTSRSVASLTSSVPSLNISARRRP